MTDKIVEPSEAEVEAGCLAMQEGRLSDGVKIDGKYLLSDYSLARLALRAAARVRAQQERG